MRIDHVKGKEVGARHYQVLVNDSVRRGLTREQIYERLSESSMQVESIAYKPQVVLEVSNLGKGYIAFFLCPNCQKKVRNLYFLNFELSCRVCKGLTYKKQDKRKILINRLIWDDELRERYSLYPSLKYLKLVMEAEWAREAIIDSGYEIGQELVGLLKKPGK